MAIRARLEGIEPAKEGVGYVWSFKTVMGLREAYSALERYMDKELSVELKEYKDKRSKDANAYYWVLIGKLADKLNMSTTHLHNDMLRKYGQLEYVGERLVTVELNDTDEAQRKADNAETFHIKPTSQVRMDMETGEVLRTWYMLRGSHTYNSKEMSTLVNGLVEECKDQDIETIPPEELERILREWQPKAY